MTRHAYTYIDRTHGKCGFPTCLPDIEVFHSSDVGGLVPIEGWYWWRIEPWRNVHLEPEPIDGEPYGPFASKDEAGAHAKANRPR